MASTGRFRTASVGAVAGSYIVVLKDGPALPAQVEASASSLAAAHRGRVDRVFPRTLHGFAVSMAEADARALADDPAVAYVEQNHLVGSKSIQNTTATSPDGINLWGLDRIDQPFLPLDHKYSYPGAAGDITVYVLDSGVDPAHAEFVGNQGFKHPWSAGYTDEQIAACGANTDGHDDNGHGTAVASLIAGRNTGVAKLAKIESVKVLDCTAQGDVASVVAGIEHVTATAVAPAVANVSMGVAASAAIDDAVTASIAAGVTYVVAAGNERVDACSVSPARVPGAITVGASDNTDFKASFSNFGSCVDMFAPGVNVQAAFPFDPSGAASTTSYTYGNGTSLAAPMAAGAAALLLHAHSTWSPEQVRTAMVAASVAGTVHASGAGTTTRLLRIGEPAAPTSFGLRAHANNLMVSADSGGASLLIANRYTKGDWEGFTVVDAGDGTHVGLLAAANNLYVTAESGGADPLIANRTSIGDWEKFTLVRNADGSVSFQAAVNGMYVSADTGGTSPLIANRTSVGPWEEFDLAGPSASVLLVSMVNGLLVTADSAGASPLIANRDTYGDWETFDVIDTAGHAGLLAHANGRIVSADSAGAAALIANRDVVGDWERFDLIHNPDGTITLQSCANGMYVTADYAGAHPLIANRTAIGEWEKFVLVTTDELR